MAVGGVHIQLTPVRPTILPVVLLKAVNGVQILMVAAVGALLVRALVQSMIRPLVKPRGDNGV